MSSFLSSITDNAVVQWVLYASLFVGVYKLVILTLSFGSLVADLFLLPATNFAKYGAKKGAWAVITGASDGLGAEFSRQLARKGFNVVLVSRTQSKLETIADEIETKFGVQTKIVAFDASVDSESSYTLLKETISDLQVTVLVNNVGQSHSIPVPFAETDPKELTDIITINNLVTLKITQAVLPAIEVATKALGARGLVLTMGSFGGLFPTPYLATYSGSKAFLQQWSAALAGELSSKNIDVELVLSYLVTSAMSKIRRTSLLIPNPKGFVAAALNKSGRRNGAQDRYATSTPYWTHAIMHYFVENTVGVYSKLANSLNLNMHKDIRRRALKKAERQKKAL